MRLGDSDLWVAPERDDVSGPDEIVPGWGNTMRDGLGVRAERGGVEIAVVGGLVLDPVLGVRDDLDRHQRRPDRRRSAAPATPTRWTAIEIVLDTGTAVLDSRGLIVTPGGIDSHVHLTLAAGVRHRAGRQG